MKCRLVYIVILLAFMSCKTKQAATASSTTPKVVSTANGKQLSEKDHLDFEYVFFNANKEKMLGNYTLAATLFQQCIKTDPSAPAPYYELANIYSFNNEKDKALEYSAKSAAMDQKNIWYQLLYADCLREKKKLNEAAIVYQNILKNYPERIDLYFELANMYLGANKPQEALKVYDRIETRIGVNDEGSIQKIRIFKQLKSDDKALKELNKLIQMFPKETKYYEILGALYEDSKQYDKALQVYNDLLKMDPDNANVHISLGGYYGNQKQTDKALQEYTLAFKNKNLDVDTKIKILLNYYDLSGLRPELKPDALALCKTLIETHPDDAKSYSVYGDFLLRDKKNAEARDQYRKALELDNSRYLIWNQVLIIDSQLSDVDAMLKESKQTIELFPTQPTAYLFNGIANIQKKNYKEAVDILKEGKEYVAENKPLSSQFYASLGDANHELKNFKEADEAYDKALELEPNNIYVLNNYAYYLSLRNEKLEKAETMSKKTNDLQPNNDSYLDTYGWILYQMKKFEDAKIWIGKAIDHGGADNSVILEHFGDILYQLGEKDKANEYWQKAKQKGTGSDFLDKKVAEKKLYE